MDEGMSLGSVHWLLDLFDELGITVWIDGGWGIDALLSEQTRSHADLDIMLPTPDAALLREALLERGFDDVPTDDRTGWNYVMGDSQGRLIDFHVIDIAPRWQRHLRPAWKRRHRPCESADSHRRNRRPASPLPNPRIPGPVPQRLRLERDRFRRHARAGRPVRRGVA